MKKSKLPKAIPFNFLLFLPFAHSFFSQAFPSIPLQTRKQSLSGEECIIIIMSKGSYLVSTPAREKTKFDLKEKQNKHII
jgi:hypothetical protein